MRKYWYIFRIELARTLEFRFDFWMSRCILVLVWLMNYYVLTTIFLSRPTFAGYTLAHMVTYAVGASLLYNFVMIHKQERIGWDIVEGTLNSYLVKPVSYFWQYFARGMTTRLVTTTSSALILGVISLFTYSLYVPSMAIMSRVIFALAAAIVIFLFLDFLLGISSFWFDRSFGPRWLFMTTVVMSSGAIFPIDLFPSWISTPLLWTPFPYLIFFPLNVFLGRVSDEAFIIGMTIAIAWAVILFFLMRVFWRRGLRRYEGVGM